MAGARPRVSGKMNVNVSDEHVAETLRIVLGYESEVRGRTLGQVCYELVMEAADVGSYPAEVRDRLAELAEESDRRAVENALRMSVMPEADAD